jgi:signal transduction histidine kinase
MDRLKWSLKSKVEENESQLISRIENSAERMQRLVEDLLEFSYVSEKPQNLETVDLNKKIGEALLDLELSIEEKKAHIDVGELPILRGNKRQLQQLFQNLISNGLKYSRPGISPHIIIRSSILKGTDLPNHLPAASDHKTFHEITISDNGIGFKQEFAERIFDMFQRLHGRAEYAGTGVGLSIARKVVENHNGYIWAESEEGEGATFKVLLPAD